MQKVEEDKTIPGEPQAQTTTLSIRTSEGGKGKRFLRIWLPLFVHFALALVVAVLVATKLNGYKALAYDWQSRFQPGNNYVLRVSDITTLLSAATTVINFFGGMWTGLIAWRCVFLLLQNDGLTVNRISSILGGTPSLRWPRGLEWAVVIILFFVFPQDYIEPLFSGSVNWNFAIQYGLPYQVGGGSPTASSSLWYWYLTQRVTRLMSTRQAEGLASISWTSTDVQTAVNGTGGIYGGISCRSVISDTVPVNSTIENAVVPCIQIHSITWPNETVPADIEYYTSTSNGNLSIIGDTPFFDYEHGGVTVIFDRERPVWDTYYNIYNQPAFSISAQYAPFPNATIYHGSMAVVVFLLRQEANGCNPVAGQSFGNTNPFGPTGYINEHFGINPFPGFANSQENCFVYGTVNFTAGVLRAPSSTFVSPRVVEYYPPGVDVANEESVVSAINQASNTIEPSIWTREALWLMPDVMTSLAVMNSSGIPTWMNLENYTSTLIRQAYFASWDMLHSTFEQNDTSTLTVYPAEDRLQASVSSARLFAWLGVTCLVPMTGFLLAYLYRKHSKRGLLVDEVGILLTDPAGVISKYPEVSAMSRVVHADEEMGRIVMDQTGGGSAQFRLSLKTEMS